MASAFCVLFAVLFSPVLLAHRFVGDPVDQLIEALPAYLGSHALWEPRTMLGYPLAANPVEAHFYPLALLHGIVGVAGAPGSFDAYEIAAYVIAACGTFGLVRATTRSTFGAIAAAFVFSLGGFMIAQAGHLDIVEPTAWVPAIFWSLTELRVRARAARAGLACAAVVALAILAGQPQTVVYAFFFALPYAAVVARRSDDGPLPYARRTGVALALGIGCAGIALVPEIELFQASARTSLTFERFQEFTVPLLQQPIRLFFPYALGTSALPPYAAHSAFDIGSFAEMSAYAGIGGMAFAMLAVLRARREPFARYWIVAAAVALVLASGNQLGLGWVTYRIPLYDLFRAPGRIAAEADLALAVLAGFGIATIESGLASARDVRRACAIVAIAIAFSYALFVTIARLSPNLQMLVVSGSAALDANPIENAALGIPFVTFACVALAAVFWVRRRASAARASLVLAVVLADMLGFACFAYWRSAAFGSERLAPPAYAAKLRQRLALSHERVLTVPHPGTHDGGIGPNLNLLWDVPSIRGYTQLQLERTRELFDSDWDTQVFAHVAASDPTFDLAAVRYVIVVEPPEVAIGRTIADPVDRFMRVGVRWQLVEQDGLDTILENEHALPRAWIARDALPADRSSADHALHRFGFDPRATAYVEGIDRAFSDPGAANDSATIGTLDDETMRVRVRCGARCFLVTSDTTYPGWYAEIDGGRSPIFPTDVALRGVAVPPGKHDVIFRYDPWIFEAGAFVSLVSVVLAVAWAVGIAREGTSRGDRRLGRPSTG